MNQSVIHNESSIQVKLLEYIENHFKPGAHYIAFEARYSHNDRRADVIVVSEDKYIHAFEIKSDIDELKRLPRQLTDYRRTFDYVTVVTTSKHQLGVKRLIGRNDGLMVLSAENLTDLKRPIKNRKFFKNNLISMCSKTALAKALDLKGTNYSLEQIYSLAKRDLQLFELKQVILSELRRRFNARYEEFKREACLPYQEEDLIQLKTRSRLNIDFV